MPHSINQPAAPQLRPRRRNLLIAAIICGIALSLGGVVWMLSSPSVAHTFSLATSRQTERFTELYFNNHQNLPKQVTAGVPASFSYHIANHEAKDITYIARISIVENGRVRVLKQERLTIKDGAEHNVTVNFLTAKADTKLELIVDLLDQGESIHFRSES